MRESLSIMIRVSFSNGLYQSFLNSYYFCFYDGHVSNKCSFLGDNLALRVSTHISNDCFGDIIYFRCIHVNIYPTCDRRSPILIPLNSTWIENVSFIHFKINRVNDMIFINNMFWIHLLAVSSTNMGLCFFFLKITLFL